MFRRLCATLPIGYLCLALLTLAPGCTRTHYRIKADQDAYSIAGEKSACTPWELPWDYDLLPPPHSRLYDPSPIDDPHLPIPSPQLYAYDLPPLRTQPPQPEPGPLSVMPASSRRGFDSRLSQWLERLPPVRERPHETHEIELASFNEVVHKSRVRRAVFQPPDLGRAELSADDQEARMSREQSSELTLAQYGEEVTVPPIPVEFWTAIPRSCLIRMLEFESVREEYRHTRESHRDSYGEYPAAMPSSEEYADLSPRLTLEDIMDLTLLNSREYQSEKEVLYRVSLGLSLERFEYDLKPSAGLNGTDVNFEHTRAAGITTNRLLVPTVAQADKMLTTGGDILARFANSVVLTFNGPSGFAADIGSDLLFDISQSVLQRDIRLEALTQSERDVVYAARDFGRFRKDLFRQQSSQYYNLLNTYRNIEIQSQNYFSFIRSFSEREVEYNYGLASRFDADQLELSILTGRNRLISTCNALEVALDNLKIEIGLPTETPINLNLTELEQLTLRDELAVTGELIRRVRRRLLNDRRGELPSTALLLSYAIVLSDRMLEAYELQARLTGQPPDTASMRLVGARLRVIAGRITVQERQAELDEQLQAANQDPAVLLLRIMGLTEELLRLTERQIAMAEGLPMSPEPLNSFRSRLEEIGRRAADLEQDFSTRLQQLERRQEQETILEQLPRMVREATDIRDDARQLAEDAGRSLVGELEPPTPDELLRRMNEQSDLVLRAVDELLTNIGSGLVPVEVDVDDAMMTALVLRFDLLNQRGFLADDWRAIKFAGDDLKSILNLRATQRISSRSDHNRPFAFSFDDSRTSLDLSFDAPFNRRAQRNAFRRTLIDYQLSLRRLAQLEDNVKLSVRNDLRSLALGKETYAISVASAALTRDSVVSNALQLQLSVPGVSVRDFRESQDAFTEALIRVAQDHISYINDRTQLFFDLELLTVGADGFWAELYDEDYQPSPEYQLPHYSLPAYGQLPRYLHYSRKIKRMTHVPPGISAVHGASRSDALPPSSQDAEEVALPDANTSP